MLDLTPQPPTVRATLRQRLDLDPDDPRRDVELCGPTRRGTGGSRAAGNSAGD